MDKKGQVDIMRMMFEKIDTYIYFIQMETGPIKIGRARNPYKRLEALQVGLPYTLELLYFFPGGAKSERAIQQSFHDEHIRGEWFWPVAPVFRMIEEAKRTDAKSGWKMEDWNPQRDFKDNRLDKVIIEG
jgi:hypothetical protein